MLTLLPYIPQNLGDNPPPPLPPFTAYKSCVCEPICPLPKKNFPVINIPTAYLFQKCITWLKKVIYLSKHPLFQRIRQIGGFVTTSECTLFMLMGDAKHPNFREVQALVKTAAPDSGLLSKC